MATSEQHGSSINNPSPGTGPCWLFSTSEEYGGHITVTIRVGPQPRDRALVGHLTMRDDEWYALRQMLREGAPLVKQDWWRGQVEFNERRLPTANDIGV